MKALGTAFLVLSGLLALPFLLNIIRPFWWKEWFRNAEAAPSPGEVAAVIVWAERFGYAAVAAALVGLALLGIGGRSTRRSS